MGLNVNKNKPGDQNWTDLFLGHVDLIYIYININIHFIITQIKIQLICWWFNFLLRDITQSQSTMRRHELWMSSSQKWLCKEISSPPTDVFCGCTALVLFGKHQTHRNVNDISERAGSHYVCSTRLHIVSLSCAQQCALLRVSHESILCHGSA